MKASLSIPLLALMVLFSFVALGQENTTDGGIKKQYVVIEMNEAAPASAGRRIFTEIGVGAGFGAASIVVLSSSVVFPLSYHDRYEALDTISPFVLLAVSASIGGGVHLGGVLTDNVGGAWSPYIGSLIGAVIPVGLDLSRQFYDPESDIRPILRMTAYITGPFIMLLGSVLAYELSHKSNKAKKEVAVLPYVGLGTDYQGKSFNTLGLSVTFRGV